MEYGDVEAPLLASCFWCTTLHPAPRPLSVCPACTAAYRGEQFAIRSLQMERCYPLDADTVDEIVSRHEPGNFALGYLEGATFTVFYIGRSDTDVARSLRAWVGRPSRAAQPASGPPRRGSRALRRVPWDAALPMTVRNAASSPYTRFAYSYARSAEAAFEKECRNVEALGGRRGLDDDLAPVPTGAGCHERIAHSA